MKTHYTYQITNNLTMQYYVGKRSTYAKSFEEDDYFGSSKYVDAAVLEYGIENFDMEPIEYHDTEDECYDHEAEIVTWDTVADPLCYNKTPGGRKGDEATMKSVVQFDLDGNIVGKFNSIQEAAQITNLNGGNPGLISRCVLHKDKSNKGFQWRYESEVGDRIFIGPVKRVDYKVQSNNTSKQSVLDTITGIFYESKRSAARSVSDSEYYRTTKEFKERFV